MLGTVRSMPQKLYLMLVRYKKRGHWFKRALIYPFHKWTLLLFGCKAFCFLSKNTLRNKPSNCSALILCRKRLHATQSRPFHFPSGIWFLSQKHLILKQLELPHWRCDVLARSKLHIYLFPWFLLPRPRQLPLLLTIPQPVFPSSYWYCQLPITFQETSLCWGLPSQFLAH